jgi:hypothetical protein
MFDVSLRHADHVRQYSISHASPSGWEIKSEEDRTLLRHSLCTDWHRVERTVALFRHEVDELVADGWEITRSPTSRR